MVVFIQLLAIQVLLQCHRMCNLFSEESGKHVSITTEINGPQPHRWLLC